MTPRQVPTDARGAEHSPHGATWPRVSTRTPWSLPGGDNGSGHLAGSAAKVFAFDIGGDAHIPLTRRAVILSRHGAPANLRHIADQQVQFAVHHAQRKQFGLLLRIHARRWDAHFNLVTEPRPGIAPEIAGNVPAG